MRRSRVLTQINVLSEFFRYALARLISRKGAHVADDLAKPASSYRHSPALALRDACRKARCDDNGKRCSACPLKDLCGSDARWLVARTSVH